MVYIAPFSHPFHWPCQTCTAGGWNIQPARSMAMKRTSSSKTGVSQQTDLFLSDIIHVWTFGNPASSLDPNLSSDLSENILKRIEKVWFRRVWATVMSIYLKKTCMFELCPNTSKVLQMPSIPWSEQGKLMSGWGVGHNWNPNIYIVLCTQCSRYCWMSVHIIVLFFWGIKGLLVRGGMSVEMPSHIRHSAAVESEPWRNANSQEDVKIPWRFVVPKSKTNLVVSYCIALTQNTHHIIWNSNQNIMDHSMLYR